MSVPFQHPFQDAHFDIFAWHPKLQSCLKYFLDHGQHQTPIQSVAALVNIRLPFQKNPPMTSASVPAAPPTPASSPESSRPTSKSNLHPTHTSVLPYVRRLVATGFDQTAIMHGFFGDDWVEGVGPLHEVERRNFLFAAKSDTWLRVKTSYDMADGQSVPFLRPLQQVSEREIISAEANWSEWLAMQDWMLGPRAPPGVGRKSDDRP